MELARSRAATVHLTGDWTITGIVKQVARLTEFEIGASPSGGIVVIDCCEIKAIDMSGFQLLYAWLQCIRMCGLHPEPVNMPGWLRDAQERFGIAQVFEHELQQPGRPINDGVMEKARREEHLLRRAEHS